MATNFFLQGELTIDGLHAMRDQIDDLLGQLASGTEKLTADAGGHPSAGDIARDKALRLHRGLGYKTWNLIYTAADNFPDENTFTFEDLAELLDVGRPTIRAWHRAASKVIKKVDTALGAEPPVFRWLEWNGTGNTYLMPAVMREAILAEGN